MKVGSIRNEEHEFSSHNPRHRYNHEESTGHMAMHGKVHSCWHNLSRVLKLNKVVVVDDAVAIFPVVRQVVHEALAALIV